MVEKAAVKRWIFTILSVYIFCQPLLDIITSFQRQVDQTLTVGTVIRSLFMVVCFFYTVIVSSKQKYYFPLLASVAIALYCVLFLTICFLRGGLSTVLGNIRYMIKLFYFPFVLCSFVVVYKEYGSFLDRSILARVSVVYMAVIFVAFITGTAFASYSQLNLGNNGWFYAANEIGAIIGILSPFTISYYCDKIVVRQKGKWKWAAFIIFAISLGLVAFCSVFVGTKAIFVSIVGYLVCYFIWYLVHWFPKKTLSNNRHILVIVCIFVSIFMLYSVSPLKQNINGFMIDQYNKIDENSSQVNEPGSDASENQQDANQNEIGSSYGFKMLNWILSDRLRCSLPTMTAYAQGDLSVKLWGLGYVEYNEGMDSIEKSMEMDFMTIFFRHGFIGTIAYLVPLFYFLFIIIKAAFIHFKKAWNSVRYCTSLYSIFLGLGIAFFAGHVLSAPAVSIFIAFGIVNLISDMKNNIFVD